MNNNKKHRALAKAVFKAMNSRDFEAFEKVILPDIVLDFPGAGRAEGDRRTILLLKSILRKYPRLQFTISQTIVENGKACVVWTNEGEDVLGNPYSNSGITLIHLLDEKIIFISDYFKDTSFIKTT